jgi:tetratricopeptide (TPR) repeat protein
VAALGLHSLVDFPFHMPTSSLLGATLAGIILGLDRRSAEHAQGFAIRRPALSGALALSLALAAVNNVWAFMGYWRAMSHLNVAWAAKGEGIGELALREVDAAMAASELPATVRREYGVVHARFNPDRAAALRAVQRALTCDPHYINNIVNAAGIEMELGALADARVHLEQALATNDELHLAHYGLGQIAAAEGRPQDARAAFERCLQLRPDYEPARRQLDAVPPRP